MRFIPPWQWWVCAAIGMAIALLVVWNVVLGMVPRDVRPVASFAIGVSLGVLADSVAIAWIHREEGRQ